MISFVFRRIWRYAFKYFCINIRTHKYFLAEKQAVEYGVKALQGCHGILGLYLGVVGSSRHILVLTDFIEKAAKALWVHHVTVSGEAVNSNESVERMRILW